MTNAQRDMQTALERTYAGEQSIESGCVMDALADLGWKLAPIAQTRPAQDELPLPASTRGLPKVAP